MDAERLSAFLKRLVCPRCRRRYARGDVISSRQEKGQQFVEVRCAKCDLRVRVLAPRRDRPRVRGRRSSTSEAALDRRRAAPVSDNDVLQVHLLLAGLSGGMNQLLRHL